MAVTDDQRRIVEEAARAMQLGPAGEATILDLFADDGVWVEPDSGLRREHAGKAAIRAALREMWRQPAPPGFAITTDRLHAEGTDVRVDWTCRSADFPMLMRGYSLYTIGPDRRIRRLELFITEAPAGPGR